MSTVKKLDTPDHIPSDFEKELSSLINKHSRENISDTPDFILARYMEACLMAYSVAVAQRDFYYRFNPWERLNSEQEAEVSDTTKTPKERDDGQTKEFPNIPLRIIEGL